jgi:hypothetical protein
MNPEQRVASAVLMLLDATEHLAGYARGDGRWDMMVANRALHDARAMLAAFAPAYDAEALVIGELMGEEEETADIVWEGGS